MDKLNLAESKRQEDFSATIQLEISIEEMEDYYGRLNQYEVWLRGSGRGLRSPRPESGGLVSTIIIISYKTDYNKKTAT